MAKRMTKAKFAARVCGTRSRAITAITRDSGDPLLRVSVPPWWVFSFRPHDQVTNYTPGACESPAGVLKTG